MKSYKKDVLHALELLRSGAEIVFYDLETTGMNRESDRILSISGIKCKLINNRLKEVSRMNLFLNPGFSIPPHITDINHISNDMIKNCPTEQEKFNEIKDFFDGCIFCGYNSNSFDEKFLTALYARNNKSLIIKEHIDVLRIAKEILPDLKDHKLSTLAEYYNVSTGLEFHNSIDDVIATIRVFIKALGTYINTMPNVETTK